MNVPFLSNLPRIGDSIAKTASEGGQFIADLVSVYGFFVFCLVLVGFCLLVPFQMYEKYYKVADDERPAEAKPDQPTTTNPAA